MTKADLNWQTTKEFASPIVVHALFAHDIKLVEWCQSELDVVITTREGWLKLEANTAEKLQQAELLVTQLQQLVAANHTLKKQDIILAVRLIKEGSDFSIVDFYQQKISGFKTKKEVFPKSINQAIYLREIARNTVTFGVGPAGTGKTFLAIAVAVKLLKEKQVKKILLSRPAIEAGESLGFLPGVLEDKIAPYLQPLYDALQALLLPCELDDYMESGMIEIAPLAYMRGRTLKNAFVILDEGQNATNEQMYMFLTRLGENSKYVITGDSSQIDLKKGITSGLKIAQQILAQQQGIFIQKFNHRDVQRHPLVAEIVRLYELFHQQQNKNNQ